ncbi:chemotaxis protein methyltransferase CheR [Pseudomonas fluvialis]|uniref:Chemotaxis protein methyltransferase n=1 Tax=Pseudomonas fluvialis TaxID=1793966 RepID=A0A7X0ESM7_9PSED|nr:CheR family methyltransferase [Pseudomonas fluvialis]MBB6342722.1 chemotaxis protein methyltransferase CheR [Pseudomonas fluvialis]
MAEEVREFHYRAEDFQQVRRLLYQRSGISLSESKDQMVYSRLARRLRVLGLDSFGAYFNHLQQHDEEWQEFVNALTTNLTSFFRESHHFASLAEYLQKHPRRNGPIRIWCSAASTGEEPYSLAITAMEAFASLRPPVQIIASDIDTGVLQTAAQGIYPLNRIDQLSSARKKRFFLRGKGRQEGMVRVRDELRELIEFQQINLLDPRWPIEPGLDVIFCRNVMIYFDKPTQQHLLERMVKLLRSDGLFFAGHSESFVHATHLVRLIGRTVYRPSQGGGRP